MVSMLIAVVVAVTLFWTLLYALFGRREKEEGLSVDMFIAMWRTKRLLGFIDRLSRVNPRFWKVYGDVGIALGFLGMAYVFYALTKTGLKVIQTGGKQAGVQLVIPGVTVPLWYGLVGLAVVMVVHELSHGVVARAEKLPLKSVGLVLLVVIPGAFVEPDEEKLNKAPLRTRLRVYGAGSMANILTGITAVLLMTYAVSPLLVPAGIAVSDVVKGSPADGVLQKGDVILAINGHETKTLEQFAEIMNKTRPGETVKMRVLREGKEIQVELTLGEHPEKPGKGYIGIYPAQHVVSRIGHEWIVLPLFFSLYWIYLLNIGIGLMNLFPLVPLDGGRMFEDVVKEYLPESIGKPVRYAAIGVGLLLLAINIIPALAGLAG